MVSLFCSKSQRLAFEMQSSLRVKLQAKRYLPDDCRSALAFVKIAPWVSLRSYTAVVTVTFTMQLLLSSNSLEVLKGRRPLRWQRSSEGLWGCSNKLRERMKREVDKENYTLSKHTSPCIMHPWLPICNTHTLARACLFPMLPGCFQSKGSWQCFLSICIHMHT